MKSTYLLILMALLLAACKKETPSTPVNPNKVVGPFEWNKKYPLVYEQETSPSYHNLFVASLDGTLGTYYIVFKAGKVELNNSSGSYLPPQITGSNVQLDTLTFPSYHDHLGDHGTVKFVAYAADSSYYLRGDKDSILLRFKP